MKIKEYQVVKEIGSGGMGKVYLANHPDLKTHVILKELKETHRDFSERFKREAKIMMSLRHDNIAAFNDFFTFEGKKYIAMEYIDGISLADIITKKKRIDPAVSLLIMYEIARGLAYSHSRKVLHRDLKPHNILISKRGEVKIIDFGIASSLEEEEAQGDETVQELTQTGMIMGTPSYMSPEQISDMKKVTEKSDVYSLGVILYEMLTGERLFSNDLSTVALAARLTEGYRPPERTDRSFPVFFQGILRKSLEANAGKRFRNVKVMEKKLEAYLRSMETRDVNKCIAEYIFFDRFADEMSMMKPMYSSFLGSFSESRWRRRFLVGGTALVVIGAISWGLFMTELKYHIFMRKEMGALEVQYTLPLPKIAKLPDAEKYPGLHRQRAEAAKKKLHGFIDHWYSDMLLDFRLRAWLIRLDKKKNRRISVEEIMLTPKNYIRQIEDDFEIYLGGDRVLDRRLRLASDRLFRKKGSYAVKIQFNSTAYWSYLNLEPVARQAADQSVEIPFSDTPKSKVSFSFKVTDAWTGKPIADPEVLILRKIGGTNRWLRWEKLAKKKKFLGSLKNGQNYYFLFKHPDYKTGKSVRIFASKDDRMVNISARLVPVKKAPAKSP